MSKTNNLPILILDRILDYLPGNETYNKKFKNQLPILWVCHQWRETTLPAVYRNLVFYFDNSTFIHKRHYPFETNAVLFRSGRLRSYVRTLSFVGYKMSKRLPDALRQVLNQLEDDKIDLLSIDYYTHLLCDRAYEKDCSESVSTSDLEFLSWGEGYEGRNAEMEETLQQQTGLVKALQSRSRDFANIRHVDIIVGGRIGAVKWVPNTILDIYTNSIRSLVCKTYTPLVLSQFPLNLTRLTYNVSLIDLESIPIVNPLPLEHLDIGGIYSDNIWKSFAMDSSTGGPLSGIVFPNLTSLALKFEYDYMPLEGKEHVSGHLCFPKLRKLDVTFRKANGPGMFKFLSQSTPSHLDNANISGNIPMLKEFLDLSINSINYLRVMPFYRGPANSEFYQTTNRLFGKSSRSFKYIGAKIRLEDVDYNHPQLDWSRIKHLDVGPISSHVLYNILTQIPNLEHIYIDRLRQSNDIYSHGLPASLCLRSFRISFGQSSETEADTVLNIWKRSPQLREYYLYKDLENLVSYKVNRIQDKYPHLGQHLS